MPWTHPCLCPGHSWSNGHFLDPVDIVNHMVLPELLYYSMEVHNVYTVHIKCHHYFLSPLQKKKNLKKLCPGHSEVLGKGICILFFFSLSSPLWSLTCPFRLSSSPIKAKRQQHQQVGGKAKQENEVEEDAAPKINHWVYIMNAPFPLAAQQQPKEHQHQHRYVCVWEREGGEGDGNQRRAITKAKDSLSHAADHFACIYS